jgi:molybdopterin synthase sulfur carrier subunit
MTRIRVVLPTHLRHLAGVGREIQVEVDGAPTLERVLDALEARYPVLKGTIRDHGGGPRRAFIRFFAEGRDLSHQAPDHSLPEAVIAGTEPLRVVGAIAGGA